MLNTKNYFDKVQQLNWEELPEALAKGHKLVEGAAQNNWAAYNTNENIKRVVEAYFQKLSDYLSKDPMPSGGSKPSAPPKSLPKPTAPLRTSKSETPKAPAPKKSEPEDEADYETTPVEYIDTDVQFIRRYAAMHGKVKSQAQILNLLHSLQKAILERRIRKDSIYAKEIELMQSQLIKCYEQMDEMIEVKIDSKNLKRYLEIANSQEGMLSITLLKAYVSLNGKKDVRDRAERLLTRMRKAVTSGKVTKSDKYADRLNEAFVTIKTYLDSKSAYLNINKAQLNGLMGILGDDLFGQKKAWTEAMMMRALWL